MLLRLPGITRLAGLSWLRPGHAYCLLAVSTIVYLTAIMPIPPNDLWWHLRVGQIISEEARIPTTNLFSWSIPPDTPFVWNAWLAEWLLFQEYRLGHVELVAFTRNLLLLTTLGLAAVEARWRGASWPAVTFCIILFGVMMLDNVAVRPQMWAWLPFVVSMVVLGGYARGQLRANALLALPVAMAFWTNVHGTFVLGLALIGAHCAGQAWAALVGEADSVTWARVRWLCSAGIASALAAFVNPQGPAIYDVVRDWVQTPSQQLSIESNPPTPVGIGHLAFYGSILLLLFVLARSQRRPTVTDLFLICGFLWLAWSGQRYVFWFALVAMPILAQHLSTAPRTEDASGRRMPTTVNALLAIVAVAPIVLAQPWILTRLPLIDQDEDRRLTVLGEPLLSAETPVASAEYLNAHPGGRLFAELSYSSYVVWALPGRTVFVDPRITPFSVAQWNDYVRIGDGVGSSDLLAHYGADLVLLSKKSQPRLSAALAESPGWGREYEDRWSEVWRFQAARTSPSEAAR
ncbi:MAG: hypothetical protein HW416_1798 [Chloroflexi bacterium]|nr:hypothetical protein [Chloroflexota bacterium]